MEIKHCKNDKASYITFENIYDDNELDLIWQEVNFLCHEHKLLNPVDTGAAEDINGNLMKSNKGIWMDGLYSSRNISNYLSLYRKGFNELIVHANELIKCDINLKLFFTASYDTTLMSYYENSDYYESHTDKSRYTYVFWLFKEPKIFKGGDLTFPELSQTINVKSNGAVLFPSWLDHQVDKISMCDTIEKYKCNGRFAFSTFFDLKE